MFSRVRFIRQAQVLKIIATPATSPKMLKNFETGLGIASPCATL
jgi:hypothetical protein